MSLYTITVEKVKNLLRLLRGGLEDHAGTMTKTATFCVQQAVTRSIHGIDHDEMNDSPECVGDSVNNLGINFNDDDNWENDAERARCLKEFAVAELGSNTLNQEAFEERVTAKFGAKYPNFADYEMEDLVGVCENKAQFLDLIAMTVEVLQEMKSPGSEYLYLCHPRKYSHLKPAVPILTSQQMEQEKPSRSIHDVA